MQATTERQRLGRRRRRALLGAAAVLLLAALAAAPSGSRASVDPPPTPCSPLLDPAQTRELNEGTTISNLALQPGSRLSAVMLFVEFPDLPARESSRALYRQLVLRARRWFAEVSYGRLRLDVTAVERWFRMPRDLPSYGLADGISWREHRAYLADAIAAADEAVDFSRYQVVYVVAPKGTAVERSPAFQANRGSGIQADGIDVRHGATFFEDTKFDPRHAANVLIHETGHVLGLPDLYDVPHPTFWRLLRFAGGWDMMSWNGPGAHFLAWQKWKLGWLDPAQLTCLDWPGSLTATVTPLERRGGLKAIVVPTSPSSAYVVEARRRIGQDAWLCREGVLVYAVDATVPTGYGPVRIRPARRGARDGPLERCGPLYDAPYGVGPGRVARFEDRAAGISVQVLASGAEGYRVRVVRSSSPPR